jgi:hypothetical protein
MSRFGALFLTTVMLAAVPWTGALAAAEAPHKIARDAAWGCRDKHQVFNLLFLGLSTSFDDRLAAALADGSCVYFKPGEDVTVIDQTNSHGLVKIRRGGAEPVSYWTQLRNVD